MNPKAYASDLVVATTAQRLHDLANYFGISQTDIHNKTKINKGNISSYFAGTRTPAQNNIIKISKAYGVEPAWLMGMDVPMFKEPMNIDNVNVDAIVSATLDPLAHRLIESYNMLDESDKLLLLQLAESLKNKNEKAN